MFKTSLLVLRLVCISVCYEYNLKHDSYFCLFKTVLHRLMIISEHLTCTGEHFWNWWNNHIL